LLFIAAWEVEPLDAIAYLVLPSADCSASKISASPVLAATEGEIGDS
jgi:hypothetical protein